MPIAIKVTYKEAMKSLGKLGPAADKRFKSMFDKFGIDLQNNILRSASEAGIQPFSSNGLFATTRWHKTKTGGYLTIPMTGVWQDSAKTHRVYVWRKSKPMLRAWAQRYWGKANGSFVFHKRPFIKRGVRNATIRMPAMIKQAVRDSIKDRLR
jgi:hypothetical protein